MYVAVRRRSVAALLVVGAPHLARGCARAARRRSAAGEKNVAVSYVPIHAPCQCDTQNAFKIISHIHYTKDGIGIQQQRKQSRSQHALSRLKPAVFSARILPQLKPVVYISEENQKLGKWGTRGDV